MRGLTLFSGGGIFECLLKDAVNWVGAVEIDPAIAAVYRANHGNHIVNDDVCNVNPHIFGTINYLHASTVCKEFSNGKVNGMEGVTDINTACATARFIRELTPQYVTIENVRGYVGSQSLAIILNQLTTLDYWVDVQIVNAADFGTPQTRERMIVRAVRGGMFQPFRPLPPRVAWRGWFEAIADLVPSLPDTEFAEWQTKLLPDDVRQSTLMDFQNTSRDITQRLARQPSLTVAAWHGARPSHAPCAFIVDGQANGYGSSTTIRRSNEPAFTIAASNDRRPVRAWLAHGVVKKLTTRALARLQDIPDWYTLPENNKLAGTIIGNGVPGRLARGVALSLIGQ